jgi:formamidopyrimidine-DNA glycosylase
VLNKALVDAHIKSASQRGKYVIIQFSAIDKLVILHFGMSGTVHYAQTGSPAIGDDRYTKVTFAFTNNYELRWIDKRKFGKVLLVKSIDDVKALKTMGPDATKVNEATFLSILAAHANQNVKTFLMDQQNIGGIGNEYSDEILFRAGINPHNKVTNLDAKRGARLYRSMKLVLNAAIKLQRPWGEFNPNAWLLAHRSKGDHCPKNKSHILKLSTIGGRTSYWCPIDQKK